MLIQGDSLERLKEIETDFVHCCVTSPPYYGLRDYGAEAQIGLETTPDEYIQRLVDVFREVKRVMRKDGTLWLNLGDSYASKDLIGIPWRVAFALQADGWHLRQDIIWHKPNPMPESVKDRCTKAHEYIFLLTKSKNYFFNAKAIKEPCVSDRPSGNKKQMNSRGRFDKGGWKLDDSKSIPPDGRNKRSVWSISSTKSYKGAHFATFPPDLIEPCILAGCPEGGTILDPFFGAGTVGVVAKKHARNWIGIEINTSYCELAEKRICAS